MRQLLARLSSHGRGTCWLSPSEQRAWRAFVDVHRKLPSRPACRLQATGNLVHRRLRRPRGPHRCAPWAAALPGAGPSGGRGTQPHVPPPPPHGQTRLAPSHPLLEPRLTGGVLARVVRVQVDEEAVDVAVMDLEHVAPASAAPLRRARPQDPSRWTPWLVPSATRTSPPVPTQLMSARSWLIEWMVGPTSTSTSAISALPWAAPHLGKQTWASSANRSRTLPPLLVVPPSSKACRKARASALRCSSAGVVAGVSSIADPPLSGAFDGQLGVDVEEFGPVDAARVDR